MKKYKLIKEYPGSPKVCTIIQPDNCNSNKYYAPGLSEFAMLTQNTLDKFSEFWEEVIEKEYEILSLYANDNIFKYIGNKKWQRVSTENETYYDLKVGETYAATPLEIYSVKRLSDGEIFTVGDKVDSIGKIKSFQLEDCHDISVHGKDYLDSLKYIQHIKKPLFTTEDGVDIYEGDEITFVNKKDLRITGTCLTTNIRKEHQIWDGSDGYLQFSTKKAAKNYIKLHKPCLTYQEVLEIFDKTCSNSSIRNDFKTKLTKLINTKI